MDTTLMPYETFFRDGFFNKSWIRPLRLLGEVTFASSVEVHGAITTTGELDGDIIVRGSGDPNLSGRFYNGNITAVPESWANAIRSRGIREVTVDIIADDSVFDRIYTNPNWPGNQLY